MRCPYYKSIAVGNEWGVTERTPHCHIFVKTSEKRRLTDVKKHFEETMRVKVGDIQESRDHRRSVRYLTKEDGNAYLDNIATDLANANWKIQRYIEDHPRINMTDYVPKSIGNQYIGQLKQRHMQYYRELLSIQDQETAGRYSSGTLSHA